MFPTDKNSRMFSRRSIHGRIAHEIGQQILHGDLAPGEVLPSEVVLGQEFGVSRTVLREAIKVLAAKGMVESRTKIGTKVRERDQWNMLDPDVLGWSLASHEAETYATGVSEMRHILEPAGAALAAERASPEQLRRIREAYEAMAATGEDLEAGIPHDLRFHQAILEATNNAFLASMGHMIESALAFSFKLSAREPENKASSMPLHKAVLDRIEARDPRGAQAAMLRLLQSARSEIERILSGGRDDRAAKAPPPRRLRHANR